MRGPARARWVRLVKRPLFRLQLSEQARSIFGQTCKRWRVLLDHWARSTPHFWAAPLSFSSLGACAVAPPGRRRFRR